ncbi:MAG: extensin family protein [Sandaracinus sp.]|nr:extensin family protein [Sandaracinus sp.]
MVRLLVAAALFCLVAAASAQDRSAEAATYVAAWARTRPAYRERIPLGTWVEDPRRVMTLRPRDACLASLPSRGVHAEPLAFVPTPAPTPVRLLAPIDGVVFHKRREGAPVVVACELAARLPDVVRVLRRHGVTRVEVMSAYRRDPVDSFHHVGLALDVSRVWIGDEELSVPRDYPLDRTRATCPASGAGRGARLVALACDLFEARVFSSVITPNYDDGHRSHFHFDLRPDDPRHFLR